MRYHTGKKVAGARMWHFMEEISQPQFVMAIAAKVNAKRDRLILKDSGPNRGPPGFLQEYSYIIIFPLERRI